MNELKWGDKVEVHFNHGIAVERIFIHEYNDGSCGCVFDSSEDDFNNGLSFNVMKREKDQWRRIPEKKLISFDFSDADFLRDKWVRGKESTGKIVATDDYGVLSGKAYSTWEELLREFTFLDGSPCGKEA